MAELTVTGSLAKICDLQTGISKAGKEWKRQSFILKTSGDYPKDIAFSVWGEKCTVIQNKAIGTVLDVSFNPESREYNERWYTELLAWKINENQNEPQPTQPEPIPEEPQAGDDLPF